MKSLRNILFFAFIVFSMFCEDAFAQSEYSADVHSSKVEWVGYKKTGKHKGGVNLSYGNLIVQDDKIIGGTFEINMNSIQVFDSDSKKLLSHLKSEDFFDVNEFPKSTFKITRIDYNVDKPMITGYLTVKEITQKVFFYADISKNSKGQFVIISEKIKLNRADFNIRYKSTSLISNLKNSFIKDDFEINVNIISQ